MKIFFFLLCLCNINAKFMNFDDFSMIICLKNYVVNTSFLVRIMVLKIK